MSKKARLRARQKDLSALEEDLKRLQSGKKPQASCTAVVEFINKSDDPLWDTVNNPFLQERQCFVAGTPILLSDMQTYKRIEDVSVGDSVACVVPNNGDESIDEQSSMSKAVVSHTSQATSTRIATLTIAPSDDLQNSTQIQCTEEHPFWVHNKGWSTVSGGSNAKHGYRFKIGQMRIGDNVSMFNGNHKNQRMDAQILDITLRESNAVTVYNLSVANGRTYFANGILVHNKGCVIL